MTGFNKEHHRSTKYDYSYFPEICEKSISPPFFDFITAYEKKLLIIINFLRKYQTNIM